MRNATYRNVLRATKMIEAKGYDHKEANELAIKKFEECAGNEMPVEWFIARMLTKEEYEREFR